jgi:hypothetical protein
VAGLNFEDADQVPPPKELPPMPAANEDFTGDLGAFGTKVITEPEAFRKAQQEAAARRARSSLPLYQQSPWMAEGAEAAAGIFSAGMLGLVGGAVGEAIDAGERSQPLGGAGGGRLYGVLTGGFIGSAAGVWGAAALFDKDVAPGWSILGAGLGSLVGGGAAAGMLVGIDDRNTAGTLAVGTVFLSQVVGAMIFTAIGTDDPAPPPPPEFDEPRIR